MEYECLCVHLVLSRSREDSRLESRTKNWPVINTKQKKNERGFHRSRDRRGADEVREAVGDAGEPGWLEDYEGVGMKQPP